MMQHFATGVLFFTAALWFAWRNEQRATYFAEHQKRRQETFRQVGAWALSFSFSLAVSSWTWVITADALKWWFKCQP